MTITIPFVKLPPVQPWWVYCKMLGWPLLAVALLSNQPIMLAVAAHWLADFTFQGHQTSIGKIRKSLPVIGYHSFISGGYAGFIAGGLPGLLISVIIHFTVDRFYKPVMGDSVTTRIVDQTIHVLTIVAITLFMDGAM